MVIFYKKWKKYNELHLTKNKMDLNIRKTTNLPPSPVYVWNSGCKNGANGVGIFIKYALAGSVIEVEIFSDRMMKVKMVLLKSVSHLFSL